MSTPRMDLLAHGPQPDDLRHGRVPVGVSRPDLGLVQGYEVFADLSVGLGAVGVASGWLAAQRPDDPADLVLVGPDELREWVHGPLDEVATVVTSRKGRAGLARVRRHLAADLAGKRVAADSLHPAAALGRWWFAPTLDEVVQVDGWNEIGFGLVQIDAVLLIGAARSLATTDMTQASAIGSVLVDGWHPEEELALAPLWGNNRNLRPSTVVLLALLHTWTRQDLDRFPGSGSRHFHRDVEELFEQLAPGGTIDLAEADRLLHVVADDGTSGYERAVGAVASAVARTEVGVVERGARRRTAALVSSATLLWLGATWGLDAAAMSDLGLVSILRPSAYLALGLLLVAFFVELGSPRASTARLATPVVALVALLHGTPSILYGEMRYSWAWKHLGVVDYIGRTGSVDPSLPALDIYHSWPGFFSINATVVELFGLPTAVGYARWWPLLANLAVIPVLLLVYRGLGGTAGRRTAWLAVVIFLASNWIGQDYFSPQSFAYLLYLLIIGVVLQFSASEGDVAMPGVERPGRWSLAVALVAAAALVSSHQITPVVLVVALVALVVLRQRRVVALVGVIVAMTALWGVTGAWTYLHENVAALFNGFGDPAANADQTLVDRGGLSEAQQMVSTVGRMVLVVVAVLAVAGFLRQLRGRRVDLTALALLLAPGCLLLANSFGGEIGFRTYLFALPFLAWYAAQAIWPCPPGSSGDQTPTTRGVARRRGIAGVVAVSALLAGFFFGHYGKDAFYQFSGDEVAASAHILENAPPGSLLVTVTTNYPGLWLNYEHVTPVPIAREPAESQVEILADPVGTLDRWLSGEEYADGYVLLTRSQEREVRAQGDLPAGGVETLRRALDASPRFVTVWASPDATVYKLADPATQAGSRNPIIRLTS